MASAANSSGGKAAKKPSAKSRGEDDTPYTSSNDATPPFTSGRLLALYIIVAIVAGAIIGGYAAVHLIETEYKNIVLRLQSAHQSSLEQSQNNYIACEANLAGEKQSNEDEIAKLLMQADRNERAFQIRAEQYLNETITAYKLANEGLDKAERRLQALQDALDESNFDFQTSEAKVREAETTMGQLKDNLGTAYGDLARERKGHAKTAEQRDLLQGELDSTLDELDRRDLERVECDEHHRNMLMCQESLKDALADLGHARSALLDEGAAATEELAEVTKQRDEMARQIQSLVVAERDLENKYDKSEHKINELAKENEKYLTKAKTLQERTAYRNKRDVLEKFGAGPHKVKMTLEFSSEDASEVVDTASIVLELAPVDDMPHTIYNVLKMVQEKTFVDGTFILAREHILVGGPVDVHDKENNDELEQRMLNAGYFPGGVLLFREHSRDFPHAQWTIGFNELGGPVFYVNLKDNTELHGPNGSGEVCFSKIIEGVDVIQRILDIPRADDGALSLAVYIADTVLLDK